MNAIPIATDINVHIGNEKPSLTDTNGRPVVWVKPDSSSWNDFTQNFHATLFVYQQGATRKAFDMFLMVNGEKKTYKYLADQQQTGHSLEQTTFVSILRRAKSYKKLVSLLGFEDAITTLRTLNDVVLGKAEGNEAKLKLATDRSFFEGALRRDDTWDALRNGARYLSPIPAREAADSAHTFALETLNPGSGETYQFLADFDPSFRLSRRAMVIVGENGSGKTSLLGSLIEGLQTPPEWDESTLSNPARFEPQPDFSRLLVFASTSTDQYPKEIPAWRGIDYRFHQVVDNSQGGANDLAEALIDCNRRVSSESGMDADALTKVLAYVLNVLSINDSLHVEVSRNADEQNILGDPVEVDGRHFFPFSDIKGEQRRLQLQSMMIRDAPLQVLLDGNKLRKLSSGESALLRFAVQACGSLRSGSILLVDEPETHLHPRFISIYMRVLDALLEASKSIAIIATHSAYVVREVPSQRVRIMQARAQDKPTLSEPGFQTFGSSIDRISQFVFQDFEENHRFQAVIRDWVENENAPTLDEFRKQFSSGLNSETRSLVAQLISEKTRK